MFAREHIQILIDLDSWSKTRQVIMMTNWLLIIDYYDDNGDGFDDIDDNDDSDNYDDSDDNYDDDNNIAQRGKWRHLGQRVISDSHTLSWHQDETKLFMMGGQN